MELVLRYYEKSNDGDGEEEEEDCIISSDTINDCQYLYHDASRTSHFIISIRDATDLNVSLCEGCVGYHFPTLEYKLKNI